MFPYYIQGKTIKDITRHLIVQFLEVKITNELIIYSKVLTAIPRFPCMTHLKVFCLNNRFFYCFVISYVHLGFVISSVV